MLLKNKDSDLVNGLLLENSIIDHIKVASCEVVLGQAEQGPGGTNECHNNSGVKPHVFSLRLYANNKTLIPHNMLTTIGHPIGTCVNAKDYLSRTITPREESLLRQFGNFASREAMAAVINQTAYTDPGMFQLPEHLANLAAQYQSQNHAVTETRTRVQNSYHEHELNALIPLFQDSMTEVHNMFHDMTSLTGELTVCANEIATKNKTISANLLVRVILEVKLRATKLV
jgi:hypothetical protein